MSAEVYRIGVAIAMTSNASHALGVIGSDLLGLGRQAKALESELGHVRTAARGAMVAIVGTTILRGMGRLIDSAKDLNHQLALMKSAGMPDFPIAAASATAWKVALRVPGGTASRSARSLRELRMILGTPDQAAAALPDFASAAAVLSGATGRSQADAIQILAQALKLRGGIANRATGQVSDAQFGTEFNLALKAIIASGGLVDQQELRTIMQTAGPTARMMDPEQFYRLMMTAIIETGGFQAGTALSAAGRQLYGGRMVVSNAVEMERLGPVDPSKGHMTRGGRIVTDAHFLIGEDILNGLGGLFAWVQKILHPGLEKMLLPDLRAHGLEGAALAKALNQAEQAGLYRVASSQTFGSLLGFFLQQEQPVLRDQTLFEKAAVLAAYPQLMGAASPRDSRRDGNSYGPPSSEGIYSDPTSKIVAFEAAWKNLLTALGSALVNATNLLGKLTIGLNTLAAFSARYPNLMGGLPEFAAVLAGLVAVGGSLAVLNPGLRVLGGLLPTFGAGGAVARGLATLTGAGGLIALAIGIETLGNSLGHIPKWMVDGLTGALVGARVGAGAGGLPGAVVGTVVGGVASATVGNVARPLSNGEPLISRNSTGKPYAPPIFPGSGAFTSPVSPLPTAAPSAPPAMHSSPIQHESYEVPAAAPGSVNVHNIAAVYLDGHAVGQMIFRRAGDHATLPPSSGTGYDPSMTPTFTASLIGNA